MLDTTMRAHRILFALLLACGSPPPQDDAGTDGGVDAPPDAWVDPCASATHASIETVAMLSHGRYSPAVARLHDGRVLIAGGFDFAAGMTPSAEIYDPITRTLSPTDDMNVARNFATATVFPGGVLVIGGFDNVTGSVGTIERYDEASATFVASSATLAMGREAHTATLLGDGRVMIAGGLQARGLRFQNTIEIYDPMFDIVHTALSTLVPGRGFHDAAWIESASAVLMVGGDSGGTTAELSAGVLWTEAGDALADAGMRAHRAKAVAMALLPDGRAVVTGGANATDGSLSDVDVWDPTTHAMTPAAPMVTRRMAHTLTALGDGRLVAVGGWSDSEMAPGGGPEATPSIEVRGTDGTWSRLSVSLAVARLDHRVVALDACHVVVIGGQHAATGAMPSAPREVELFTIPR